MAYLVNQTRLHSLTIAGVDYTAAMLSWVANDTSANKTGLLSTTGTVRLGQVPGGYDVEDYDRDNFKRGAEVVLQVTYPSGNTARHPRGLLYVLTSSYEPETNQLVVEIGCRLALAKLTDDVTSLAPLVPIPLDPAQQTYSNISASFASAGQYLYQDNTGALIPGSYFDGDTFESTAPGEWTSVLGVTALSASPLAGGGAIPDQIQLSYRVPADLVRQDESGKIDITETDSYYYLTYPAVIYQRSNDGTLTSITGSYTGTESTGQTTSCGNTPAKPADNATPSCSEGYETVQTPLILPAHRKELTRTEYSGPAGQVSRVYSETRGPALEANGQYFADKYAYCRYTWATACQPNGGCPTDGEEEILLSYRESINYYGPANELVKSVTDNYQTTLSGAQPFNWRAGQVNGAPQNFTTLSTTDMYRVSSVIVEYSYGNNSNTQETTTYTSITGRGSGITGNIDALAGVRTFQRRISTTISANPLIPDTVNTATTSTRDENTTIRLYTGRYTQPPVEAGPYVAKEQVPVPLLFDDRASIDSAVTAYTNYITRFTKGDAYGMQIGESLREEISATWKPNMPFRYHDAKKGKLMAMRMNATTWGVDQDGSALVTGGIWLGYSDGSVTVDNNLVGDSRPDMGSGTLPPVGPGNPPAVSGETAVDSGAYAFDVNVYFMMEVLATFFEPAIPAPASETAEIKQAFTCWVGGLVVTAGDLLSPDGNGTIPIGYNGSLVTAGATVVNANIFN